MLFGVLLERELKKEAWRKRGCGWVNGWTGLVRRLESRRQLASFCRSSRWPWLSSGIGLLTGVLRLYSVALGRWFVFVVLLLMNSEVMKTLKVFESNREDEKKMKKG